MPSTNALQSALLPEGEPGCAPVGTMTRDPLNGQVGAAGAREGVIHIGIDPGISGAVAVLFSHGLLEIIDTPTVEIVKGRAKRREYAPTLMCEALSLAWVKTPVLVTMELVWGQPQGGASGMFHYGRGVGLWEGIIAALRLPLSRVPPVRWKKRMGVTGDKAVCRLRAMELLPEYTSLFSRVKDADRAEAALLALYGRWTFDAAPDKEGP